MEQGCGVNRQKVLQKYRRGSCYNGSYDTYHMKGTPSEDILEGVSFK